MINCLFFIKFAEPEIVPEKVEEPVTEKVEEQQPETEFKPEADQDTMPIPADENNNAVEDETPSNDKAAAEEMPKETTEQTEEVPNLKRHVEATVEDEETLTAKKLKTVVVEGNEQEVPAKKVSCEE